MQLGMHQLGSMAYIVVVYIVMACIIMAYVAMALCSCGHAPVGFRDPRGAAFSPDGSFALITNHDHGNVAQLDLATGDPPGHTH